MGSLEHGAGETLDELVTALDLVRWGASRFSEADLWFGHGTDNAVDEALTLVMHALHLEPGAPDELLRGKLTRGERKAVLALLKRRVEERIPAPYLTQQAYFAGLRFRVNEHVVVPRSPIAEWIDRGFAPWVKADNVARILDLCTGSGCIAVACAMAFPGAAVDAVDVSAEALEVARSNIRAHGLSDRIRLLKSDLFAALRGRTYDLIVSNPPYVSAAELANCPEEYRHEPVIGLCGGEDGLDYIRPILTESVDVLTSHGVLVMEVGAARAALLSAYPRTGFIWLDLARGGDSVFLLTASELPGG